jgi:hypothetical protein
MQQPNWWKVPRDHEGKTIHILGGGPSLRFIDFRSLEGRVCIAINRSFIFAPWADIVYFCDRRWWQLDASELLQHFTGRYIVTISGVCDPRVKNLRNTGNRGLEASPFGLKFGGNSGYQAINLAVHLGAKNIVLHGYDLKTEGLRTHGHQGYSTPGLGEKAYECRITSALERFKIAFPMLVQPLKKAGVSVYNANPDSALNCFPKITFEQALELGS